MKKLKRKIKRSVKRLIRGQVKAYVYYVATGFIVALLTTYGLLNPSSLVYRLVNGFLRWLF